MDPLNDLVKGTNFPWLMSNVIDKETNRPLAEGKVSQVIEWEGCRIGLVSIEKMIQMSMYNMDNGDQTVTVCLFFISMALK